MKISTRGRYGLKAIVYIAEQGNLECINLKKISQKQGISENYLEQLITSLKKVGFIKSVRGAKGGYILNKPAKEIYVGDVLRALEGSLYPVECLDGSGNSYCGNSNCNECTTKSLWGKMYQGLTNVVDNVTIQDILDDNILNYNKEE